MTSLSRRDFIKRATPMAGLVGLTSGCGHLGGLSGEVEKLRGKVKGRVIVPGDPEFESARRVFYWNAKTERHPKLVVKCAHEEDVLRAIEFARRHELEVAVRSGGHSHLGWGTSTGLVIDLSGMKAIAVDAARRVVRLEAGVLSGEVARAAGRNGLAPVLGQCPGVGASGVTLGGGLGWLSGLHGASCDNLVSARMATADGRAVSADPELLWALRGAGANFGVTTSFECQLHEVGPVTGGDVHYPAGEARVVLRFFRELMDEAPDGFQATLNLTQGERGVFVSFCHAGSDGEIEGVMQKLRAIARTRKEFVKKQPFAEFAERPAATNPANAQPPKFRGIQTVYRDRLSDDLIDVAVDRFERAAPEVVMGISHYMHGQVCRVVPTATAFPLREAGALNVRLAYTWDDAATGKQLNQWADESLQLLRPKSAEDERVYANFQTYQAKRGGAAVYGANYARLIGIKKQFDPENIFRLNSNIAV